MIRPGRMMMSPSSNLKSEGVYNNHALATHLVGQRHMPHATSVVYPSNVILEDIQRVTLSVYRVGFSDDNDDVSESMGEVN